MWSQGREEEERTDGSVALSTKVRSHQVTSSRSSPWSSSPRKKGAMRRSMIILRSMRSSPAKREADGCRVRARAMLQGAHVSFPGSRGGGAPYIARTARRFPSAVVAARSGWRGVCWIANSPSSSHRALVARSERCGGGAVVLCRGTEADHSGGRRASISELGELPTSRAYQYSVP